MVDVPIPPMVVDITLKSRGMDVTPPLPQINLDPFANCATKRIMLLWIAIIGLMILINGMPLKFKYISPHLKPHMMEIGILILALHTILPLILQIWISKLRTTMAPTQFNLVMVMGFLSTHSLALNLHIVLRVPQISKNLLSIWHFTHDTSTFF